MSSLKEEANDSSRLRLAIFLPNWIGDACMATPMLRAVRDSYPNAHIVAVTNPVVAELLNGAWGKNLPWIDQYLLVHRTRRKARSATIPRWRLPAHLKSQRLNAILLCTNSFWSAAVAWLSETRTRIGYQRDGRGWLLSDPLPVARSAEGKLQPVSAVDYYLGLADWLGCTEKIANRKRMQLCVHEKEQELADKLWQALELRREHPTIVINSNAATKSDRVWPADKVCALSKKIASELGHQVLLHCGPGESNAANETAAAANHPNVKSMGNFPELPIGLTKTVMQRAACVVSTDSGPRHIAVSLNRPVVSLFGPTDPAWTKTYNCPELEVVSGGNIQQLEVERVYQAVEKQLESCNADLTAA